MMTAANLVVLRDCVHLITDGLNSRNGAPHSNGHKVLSLPHLNLAVAVRGTRPAMGICWELISGGARSYDDLRDKISTILRPAFDAQRPILKAHFGADALYGCEVVVAGWSESSGPAGFVLGTSDLNAACGLEPWKPWDITGTFFSPSSPELATDFACFQLEFDDVHAIALVDRQRHMRPNDVGGFVQCTTVRQAGIETRILRGWGD